MSLCFNWSCDFQRFTKSKKLSKFQVRTTTSFNLNKVLSTSLFNLQGAIFLCLQRKIALRVDFIRKSTKVHINALAFCPLKARNTVQSKRLLLIDSLFIISEAFSFVKNFFKTFFEVFEAILSKLKLFWPLPLSKQLI